jgi:uncharacterized heparinase superfamily protein
MANPRSGLWLQALGVGLRRQIASEWRGSPPHLNGLERPRAEGWAAGPRDVRPVSLAAAEAMAGGVFVFAGETLTVPAGGDPWSLASPSRRFAVALHRFDWLPNLMELGEAEQREALRLTLAWSQIFGRWNRFSWGPDVLERRVFNLACAGRALAALASPADASRLAQSLGRQARQLAQLAKEPPRRTVGGDRGRRRGPGRTGGRSVARPRPAAAGGRPRHRGFAGRRTQDPLAPGRAGTVV